MDGKNPPAANITLTFAAGERRKTVTIASQADADITNETVTLTLSNVVSDDSTAVLGTQLTTNVVITDDRKQTVTIAASPDVINEGTTDNTSTVTVTLAPAPTGTATVNISDYRQSRLRRLYP